MDRKTKSKQEILDYCIKEDLNKYFGAEEKKSNSTVLSAHLSVDKNHQVPFPPDLKDLTRLHKLIRQRKVTTVLEFGVGYSTIVMADAIAKNDSDYSQDIKDLDLRRSNRFEIHSVDASKKWIKNVTCQIPNDLKKYINLHFSPISVSTFNGRICSYYDNLPNITPDFIYIDGPSNYDVSGEIGGISFRHPDRTINAGDVLRMEPLFLPGTLIVLDGRTNNARFIKNNFQRNFLYSEDRKSDVHTFELKEKPLGTINQKQIEFCLGKSWLNDL